MYARFSTIHYICVQKVIFALILYCNLRTNILHCMLELQQQILYIVHQYNIQFS
jgi:hypothetical protein